MDVILPVVLGVGVWLALFIAGEVEAARRAPEIKKKIDEEWLAKADEWNRVDPP